MTSNLHQSIDKLKRIYKILSVINLNDFDHPSHLFEKVLNLKKLEFLDYERILFVYSKNKIKFLSEILEEIDIPLFFIILLVPEQEEPIVLHQFNTVRFSGAFSHDAKTFDLPENFCIYPWINIEINNLGEYAPCCKFKSLQTKDKVDNLSISQVYQSVEFDKVRARFRNNEKLPECTACWDVEDAGNTSMRRAAKHKFKDIYYNIDYTKNQLSNLKTLDLKLGNACNLSCRICSETYSSAIADFKLKFFEMHYDKYKDLKETVKWAKSGSFSSNVLEIADNLLYLDVYGGEPFMNKLHFDLLKLLIAENHSHQIQIDYNSNGTIYSEKFFDYWSKFKKVKISFSIDDIEQRFEIQRNGSFWHDVESNISKYNQKTSKIFATDVFTTVSVQNIYYLPELLDWVNDFNFSEGVSLNVLEYPKVLAINNLPDQVKDKIEEKLSSYKKLIPIVNYMRRPQNSNDDLIEHIQKLDRQRNQNFFATHHEFSKILESCKTFRI